MKSFLTLVVILSVAIGVFYAVTSSNLLVRYSYDVYACASPSGETIELKFNDIEIGENVVLTSPNGESSAFVADEVSQSGIGRSAGKGGDTQNELSYEGPNAKPNPSLLITGQENAR